jgi:hypothetical protein
MALPRLRRTILVSKIRPATSHCLMTLTLRRLKETLTKQDFAAHLKITVRTLDRRRADGLIPKPDIDFGKLIRWLPLTIHRWERKKNHAKRTTMAQRAAKPVPQKIKRLRRARNGEANR